MPKFPKNTNPAIKKSSGFKLKGWSGYQNMPMMNTDPTKKGADTAINKTGYEYYRYDNLPDNEMGNLERQRRDVRAAKEYAESSARE